MINKNNKGITLIEILIGIVITSIIMGAMLTSYNVVNGSYSQVIDKASIGNSTRAFSEMLLRDIRMAGYKYFDDNLITTTGGEMYVPILITKNTSSECCDTITIVYGDFDRNLVDDNRYIRYKIQYSFHQLVHLDRYQKDRMLNLKIESSLMTKKLHKLCQEQL